MTASIDDELHEIDLALARLDAGRYGRCETCHEPISEDRLWAVPWARRCVRHEEDAEHPRTLLSGAAASVPTALGGAGTMDEVAAPSPLGVPPDDDDDVEPAADELGAEEDALHLLGTSTPAPEEGWSEDLHPTG